MRVSVPQRSALEAIAEELVCFYTAPPAGGRYVTRSGPRISPASIHALHRRGYVETVFRGSSREGVVVLTDTGRDVLAADERLAAL